MNWKQWILVAVLVLFVFPIIGLVLKSQPAPTPAAPVAPVATPPPAPATALPELDCAPTGEPAKVINGKKYTPVKCKGLDDAAPSR